MPQAVLGGSPVSLVNKVGQQMSIPLDRLSFASGAVDASAWSGWSSPDIDQGQLQHYLNGLAGRGLLRPAPPPPISPAMIITARDPGSTGLIKVTIGTVTPNVNPDDTTVEMTVELVETHKNLHKADVQDVLGKDAASGTKPGLVYASKKPTSALDASGGPQPFDATGAWSFGNLDLQTRRVAGAGDSAPTAELIKNGTDDVNLTIKWSKHDTVPMKSLNATFGFLLTIAKAGAVWGVPASKSFSLLGGTDGGPPTPAQSTVPGV